MTLDRRRTAIVDLIDGEWHIVFLAGRATASDYHRDLPTYVGMFVECHLGWASVDFGDAWPHREWTPWASSSTKE